MYYGCSKRKHNGNVNLSLFTRWHLDTLGWDDFKTKANQWSYTVHMCGNVLYEISAKYCSKFNFCISAIFRSQKTNWKILSLQNHLHIEIYNDLQRSEMFCLLNLCIFENAILKWQRMPHRAYRRAWNKVNKFGKSSFPT